jgi:hypothetical protein
MSSKMPPSRRGLCALDFGDWLIELAVGLTKVVILLVLVLGLGWLVSRYQLTVLMREGTTLAHRAGLLTEADVAALSASLGTALFALAPWSAIGFLVAIATTKVLEYQRVESPVIRIVGAVLCGIVSIITLVLSVIGFYEATTLGGVVAGTAAGLFFGAFGVPARRLGSSEVA